MAQVEAQLRAILKRGTNAQNAETAAWARRTLALTLASDQQRAREALSILAPAGQAATGSQAAKTLEDPEDLRVLARVLGVQTTMQDRKQAIEILESLVSNSLANAEDRFLLAQLHDLCGDWSKARERYRELNLRTKNPAG